MEIDELQPIAGEKKYIIFDLSEVLLTGIKDTGLALAEKHQLSVAKEHTAAWTHHATPLLTPLVKEFFNGNVSEDEYINEVLATYPQLGEAESLKQHIRNNFKEVEGTRDIIINLKTSGYTLALFSVHAKEWVDYCEQKFNYHDLFDVRVYSYEDKVSKPDPVSFQKVLSRLAADPAECLFIDDSVFNIEAARNLGIHSILFTTADELQSELRIMLPDLAP
ncbi:MAG: HAD-IA family hydrolase [Patescibacteria group bacterium]|jgi:putative hydrolase of the HAD superfamily